jgi:hypothetical protein
MKLSTAAFGLESLEIVAFGPESKEALGFPFLVILDFSSCFKKKGDRVRRVMPTRSDLLAKRVCWVTRQISASCSGLIV